MTPLTARSARPRSDLHTQTRPHPQTRDRPARLTAATTDPLCGELRPSVHPGCPQAPEQPYRASPTVEHVQHGGLTPIVVSCGMSIEPLDALTQLQAIHRSPDSYRPEDVRDRVLTWRQTSASLELANDVLLLQAAERGRGAQTPPAAWLAQSDVKTPRSSLYDALDSARAQQLGVQVTNRREAAQALTLIDAATRDGRPIREAVAEAQAAVDSRSVRRRAAQIRNTGEAGLRRMMIPESSSSDLDAVLGLIKDAAESAGIELPDSSPERVGLALRVTANMTKEAMATMLPHFVQP